MSSVSAVTTHVEPKVEPRATFAPEASALAAAVALVLSATTVVLASIDSRRGDDYQVHTLLLGSDLALLVLAVVAARELPAALRSWRRHACALGGLAVGLTMVPSLLLNPSDRGVAALLRWAAAVALAVTLGSVRRDGRRLVIGALAAVTLAHVAVALAQRAVDGTVGLGAIGEPSAYQISGRFAATGLTVHPYVLAAWCAVAGTALLAFVRRRQATGRLPMVAGVAAFAAIGLTIGRSGILAALLALAALAVSTRGARSRAWKWTMVAAAGALAFGVLLNASTWAGRAGEAGESGAEAVSNGRGALLRQAGNLLEDHPVTGVGPGRYVLALQERPELVALSDQAPRPVHLTPFLLIVEGGVLVIPGLLALGLAIAWSCRRGGAPAVALTLAMAPFLALDHLAWSYPQGILLTGVWLGALDLLARRGDEVPTAPSHGAAIAH